MKSIASPTPILIIASRASVAGGENYLLSVFREVNQERFHPIVWLPGDGPFHAALEAAGIESVIEPVDYGWLKPPQTWYHFGSGFSSRVRRLTAFIEERGIRLVHTNSNQILEGALASRLAGVPHLYLAHIDYQSNLPIYQRVPLGAASFAKLMDRLSEGILAVSHHVASKLCPPLDPQRVTVVHNGIETSCFDEALAKRQGHLRQELGLSDDTFVITAAGRITEDKGFDILLEAAVTVIAKHPRAHFLVAGGADSTDHLAKLERYRIELGLEGRVHFLGLRGDLPQILAESDIFLLTSRREGHPYVLLEAMACACPVVASRCGGVDETVSEGETGYIVEIGDVAATADRVSRLLTDTSLRQAMGEAGRHRVAANFNARQTAEGLFAKYEELLAAPASTPGDPGINLFLQATDEIAFLGNKMLEMEERLRKTEGILSLFTRNPVSRALNRLRGR